MFPCPYSSSHSNRFTSTSLSPSVDPSLSYSTSPSLFPVSSPHPFFLPSLSPSLHFSLAWVPRQMVHASRCSPPNLSQGKTKAESKQNLMSREVHSTINPGFDQRPAFYRQVGGKHTGGHKINLPNDKYFF